MSDKKNWEPTVFLRYVRKPGKTHLTLQKWWHDLLAGDGCTADIDKDGNLVPKNGEWRDVEVVDE